MNALWEPPAWLLEKTCSNDHIRPQSVRSCRVSLTESPSGSRVAGTASPLHRSQAQFQSPSLQVLNPQPGSRGLLEKCLRLPCQPRSLPPHLNFSTHHGVPRFPGLAICFSASLTPHSRLFSGVPSLSSSLIPSSYVPKPCESSHLRPELSSPLPRSLCWLPGSILCSSPHTLNLSLDILHKLPCRWSLSSWTRFSCCTI